MYKKVLVAVDGYEPSLGAAKRAVELAVQYGLEVIVLQVEEDIPLLPGEKILEKVCKPITDKPLELVEFYAKKHGVDITTIKEKGGITACILKAVEKYKVDLIIVGDSGRKGLEKFYFGSVAQAVSENAKSSVLIVKRGSVNISDMVALLPLLPELEKLKKIEIPVFNPKAFKQNRNFITGLSIAFIVLYAIAVALTSEPLKELAVFMVFGLPLAIWAGLLLFAGGLIIIRLKISRGGGG